MTAKTLNMMQYLLISQNQKLFTMTEKYIRQNRNSFNIVKNSRTYAKLDTLEDAIFLRDLLDYNGWDINAVPEIYGINGHYIVFGVIDGKIHLLLKSDEKPDRKTVDKLIKMKIRNPNNSKYGLNITRVFDVFVIKKRIAGDDYIFGYYDCLEDAEFVRNFLLDNMWNVMAFSQIQYDEDEDNYKVVEVIDERVYVLDTFHTREEINLNQVHREFLNKITKHKLGLAQFSYLDELTDQISDLENRFDVKASDDVWTFKNTHNPLNDIIFNLTPFQKSIYDAVDGSTFEEIKKSLIRFKSGNFDEKIRKNLNELERSGLISKKSDVYIKK